jgi:4-amino-4-deoxy-L-arabinose transferase-like glycosyltransferase
LRVAETLEVVTLVANRSMRSGTTEAERFDHQADTRRGVRAPLLLGVLVVAVTALNVWWRTMEKRPPHWDMAHHLWNSLVYLDLFRVSHPFRFFVADKYYPPFVYWVTDGFYAVLGNQAIWVAVLSNVVWIGVLVFSTYGVGKRLWNTRVGLLSAAFVVAAPMIVDAGKDYMLDLPLTSIAALALYLLVRSDGFSTRRHSLLLGATCGCGLLVKWTFPLVVALPVLHATVTALHEARVGRRFDRLLNLAGAGIVTFVIAGAWYVHNARSIGASLFLYNGPEGAKLGDPPVASIESALWYLWNLVNRELYLVPFLLVVAGIAYCFRERELARRNLWPILMAVGTYVAFSMLRHKDARYTLPLLPPLAVIATSWLEYVSTRTRALVAGVFVAYSAAAFLAISFGTSLLPKQTTIALPTGRLSPGSLYVFAQHGYINGPPTADEWHQEDVFRAIAAFPAPQRRVAYEGPDTTWFNRLGNRYYALRYNAELVSRGRARFVIARSRKPPIGFVRIRRWELPDGERLALYDRVDRISGSSS